MSERIGKMLTCDRCGSFVFLNYTGKHEFDGGYTQIADFEDPPKGWGYGDKLLSANDLDNIPMCATSKRLCPDCYKEYCYVIQKFYDKDAVAKSVRERSTVYEP